MTLYYQSGVSINRKKYLNLFYEDHLKNLKTPSASHCVNKSTIQSCERVTLRITAQRMPIAHLLERPPNYHYIALYVYVS